MTIPYDIQISDRLSTKEVEVIENYIKSFFSNLNQSINHWNEESELYQIKKSPFEPSSHLLRLVKLSKYAHKVTKGRFDPSLHLTIKTWKEHLSLGTIPKDRLLSNGSRLDKISTTDQKLIFENKFPILDFDGISKGYAVDEITKNLQEMGYHNLFINWGGEIKATGQYDKIRCWKVLIASPINPKVQESLDLKNLAMATSADYEQLYQTDKETIYTHFINPKTFEAKKVHNKSLCSVTVMHKSCAIADAIATAAMTFEDKRALKEWISKVKSEVPDLKFWVFFRDETTFN